MLIQITTALLICVISGSFSASTLDCENKQCSHSCSVVSEKATCSCPEDMTLGPDEKTCQAPVYILMSMVRGINVIREDTKETHLLLPVRGKAFDFHYKRKEIFVVSNNTVLRYAFKNQLSLPSAPTAIHSSDTLVTDLALDWVHDQLYLISQQREVVQGVSVNGTNSRVLVEREDGEFRDINVDPLSEKLFWLDHGSVSSSDLAGGNLKTKLADLRGLDALAVDVHNQLIYTIGNHGDGINKVVRRCKYDGSNKEDVFTVPQPGSKVYGFSVLDSSLYWQTSFDGENLYKSEIPQAGGKATISLVEELLQIVYDIKICHPNVQKTLA